MRGTVTGSRYRERRTDTAGLPQTAESRARTAMPDPSSPAEASDPDASRPIKTITSDHTGALRPQDTVESAGEKMREHQASTWPVAEDRKLVGMVEQENPDWRLGGEGHDPKAWTVGEIMNPEAVFCYEDQDCATARRLMDERGLHAIPVVDRDMRIVGIFTREDLQRGSDSAV